LGSSFQLISPSFSAPALQLLFVANGFIDIVEAFPVYEVDGVVVAGETLKTMVFVLPDALA
jgi:hypothetical protein